MVAILVGKEEAMAPIQIGDLSEEQIKELADLYRTTRDVRLRTRSQMVSTVGRTALHDCRDCHDCT